MQNPTIVYRGNVLRATSKIDPTSNVHIGDDYYFERVAMGSDRDFMNNEVGLVRYAYNLFNTKNGAARVSKSSSVYVGLQDGIRNGIPLALLEQHFKVRFAKISDARIIKDGVTKLLDEEVKQSNKAAVVAALGATLVGLFGAMALTDNGRTVRIQQ